MNSKALFVATATILALSAVSCGKEDSESSVSIAYGESTRTVTTEEATETKTTATGKTTKEKSGTGTATVTTTSAVSGTETTTTDSTEETSTETTTSADISDTITTTATATTTVTVGNTTVQAETTAPITTVETTAEETTENSTSAPEESSNNDDNNEDDNNNTTEPEDTQPPETTEPATEAPTENDTFEFKFTVDNLLNNASGLLAMLGTPSYSGEATGCTSNGNDVKIYQYDGLEIQCYIDGETEYIFSIEITGDKYITDRGIKTGCSRAEVESAYGTGETSSNMTVYYTGNNEMDIEYDGDTVVSIFFYAPV